MEHEAMTDGIDEIPCYTQFYAGHMHFVVRSIKGKKALYSIIIEA